MENTSENTSANTHIDNAVDLGIRYPDMPFFQFWTMEENELVCKKYEAKGDSAFCIAVNFGGGGCVEPYFYEYDDILQNMLDISSEAIHDGMGYQIHTLVKFKLEKQFAVLVRNYTDDTHVIGHYDKKDDAITFVAKQMAASDAAIKTNGMIAYTMYAVVDLSKTVPFFLDAGKPRRHREYNAGHFFRFEIGGNASSEEESSDHDA